MAKITLVTRNFPPLTGGMERLLRQVYIGLKDHHDCDLVGPNGCRDFADRDDVISETSVSPTPLFLLFSFVKSIYRLSIAGRPDVVVGGSGLVGPVVVLLARLFSAKSMLLVHGLDIVVESRLYQFLFVPFLRRADLVICNSKNTAELAIQSGVRADRIEIICPGVEIPDSPLSQTQARELLGLHDKTMLLSVGRLIPRKGIAEFITNSFVEMASKNPNLELWIAGGEPQSALNKHHGSVVESINKVVRLYRLESRIKLLGRVDDVKLQQLYAAADVFIFPLIDTPGDVEGFGMVAIEAAAYGTPTVAFDCGGVSDAVEQGGNGYLVTPGDYAEFDNRVMRVIKEQPRDQASEYAKQFSWENYSLKLNNCIQIALGKDK
ncbi:MAG: phosphatidylinositol alpha-1,6-mannosyltransferase [Gammaproteobacteria bacterium]|jgi:phosphatidylinositol alpha-1,6-mannosyltransferase